LLEKVDGFCGGKTAMIKPVPGPQFALPFFVPRCSPL
jgi:hypothetical protein